ncbi:MAG: hypothetical protein NC920_04905 [Candidatus Omnitrophica bacterium]|nr:hypothetical protein [Candidatus Omnitrophota bacterium]
MLKNKITLCAVSIFFLLCTFVFALSPVDLNSEKKLNLPALKIETFSLPAQPGSAGEAWEEVERILNTQYKNREEQVEALKVVLDNWAKIYNEERKAYWEKAQTWGFFPGATSIAQVDLTAMIRDLMQNKFYGTHTLYTHRVNLLKKAAEEAELWYTGFPEPSQVPSEPRNPRERP